MVDFRKWLLASAATALLLGLGSSAFAQGTPAFVCQGTAGNPNVVRAEGVAELVGDLVLNCTGGAPTAFGTPIPLSNVLISLNTNVTSRLTSATPGSLITEALLAIDDPFPTGNGGPVPTNATQPAGSPSTQLGCIADGLHGCGITGTGIAFGTFSPYSGSAGHYNVFQGISNGSPNQLTWLGVPIDAPGTQGTRIIRITNVRANACMLGVSSTLIPTTITELIGINGGETIIINGPQQVVGEVEKGLTSSVNSLLTSPGFGPPTYAQCNNLNAFLLMGFGGSTGYLQLIATEGFAASFKPVSNFYDVGGFANLEQNVFGSSYNTESGFTDEKTISGLDESGRLIGLADTGTQIQFTVTGIPSGVQLFVPAYVDFVGPGGFQSYNDTGGVIWGGLSGGYAVLVSSGGGSGDYNPPTAPTGVPSITQITPTGGTAVITYLVEIANPSIQESMIVPVEAAWITSSSTSPLSGAVSVATNFAPLATSTELGVAAAPIPRFCQPYGPISLFTISPCTCNLLFPFVTSAAGFDTGIAIANTSEDPYGTATQSGTVNIWYYGSTTGGGAAPPTVTTGVINPGSVLTFSLFSGGSGVAATPGFTGYLISQANFQFCHGFAFISDLGAQKLAEGYLAIGLDISNAVFGGPGTGSLRGGITGTAPPPGFGEVQAH